MPNRLVANGTDAPVTINTLTAQPRTITRLNIADADLPTWVGTAGIAVLSDTATMAEKDKLARALRRGTS